MNGQDSPASVVQSGQLEVLVALEQIGSRRYLSAARAAARGKPVVVLKAGHSAAGARAAASHTGMLAGSDAVYDAAFRRAGMLRVATMAELFDAAETLALHAHACGPLRRRRRPRAVIATATAP
jgi:acetyltransferase